MTVKFFIKCWTILSDTRGNVRNREWSEGTETEKSDVVVDHKAVDPPVMTARIRKGPVTIGLADVCAKGHRRKHITTVLRDMTWWSMLVINVPSKTCYARRSQVAARKRYQTSGSGPRRKPCVIIYCVWVSWKRRIMTWNKQTSFHGLC